jgi:hypothetical protein
MQRESAMSCLLNDTSKTFGDSSEEGKTYLEFATGDGSCCVNQYPPSSDEGELYRIRAEVIDLLSSHFFCSSCPANIDRVRENHHIHPMLEIMWRKSEEWHLLPTDHCDVYGFNIWAPMWLDDVTDMVFGGPSERKAWSLGANLRLSSGKGLPVQSCALPGWICCMAFSEFDYLLVCLNRKSSQYGNVHHVNVHNDEENFCCTIDELFLYLLDFVNEAKELRTSVRRDNSTTKLNRGLRRTRDAIMDALK